MKNRFKTKTVYKNKNGKIVSIEDMKFGGKKYALLDTDGNYVKNIPNVFKVSDYL